VTGSQGVRKEVRVLATKKKAKKKK